MGFYLNKNFALRFSEFLGNYFKKAMNIKVLIVLLLLCKVFTAEACVRHLFHRRRRRHHHYWDNNLEAQNDEAAYKKIVQTVVDQLDEDMGEEKARMLLSDLTDMSDMIQDKKYKAQLNKATSNEAVEDDGELDEETLKLLEGF